MKNLLLSSLFFLFLSACSLGHYSRLSKQEKSTTPNFIFPFVKNNQTLLFKTNLDIYSKSFSGLLVVKQISSNDFRIIFTTELGMKLFDFEITDSAFIQHYCVPQLNRPKLLNILQEDLSVLLSSNILNSTTENYYLKSTDENVLKTKWKRYKYYYFSKNQHLNKIEKSKNGFVKVRYLLNNYTDDVPQLIQIKHYNIRLKIELRQFKNQS
jgi:hypothetical protein